MVYGYKKTRRVRQRETHSTGFLTLACALVRRLEEQDQEKSYTEDDSHYFGIFRQ
jgi:hypothetical protein